MAKNKKDTQKVTMDELLNELKYLVNEGFIVYNPVDETYRMKTEDEIEIELKKLR